MGKPPPPGRWSQVLGPSITTSSSHLCIWLWDGLSLVADQVGSSLNPVWLGSFIISLTNSCINALFLKYWRLVSVFWLNPAWCSHWILQEGGNLFLPAEDNVCLLDLPSEFMEAAERNLWDPNLMNILVRSTVPGHLWFLLDLSFSWIFWTNLRKQNWKISSSLCLILLVYALGNHISVRNSPWSQQTIQGAPHI